MDRCTDLEKLKSKMKDMTAVSCSDVYPAYKIQEEEKWRKSHGDEMANEHLESAKKIFNKLKWYAGKIDISEIMLITMCNTHWIQEIACSEHSGKECCINCKESRATLEQVVKTFNIGIINRPKIWDKIFAIKNSIMAETLDLFVIITDDNPPYVYDGNNRLIAAAILPVRDILCYLGIGS